MEYAVYDSKGKKTSKTVKLNKDIFGTTPNDHAIYLDVKQFMASARQGNAKSKERGEIAGSTRKIKKQKGTGTARAGSIKSPVLRGGGTIFGPRPRNYDFKLNKKVKQIARKSALSYKAKEKNITIVENISFDAPKTKGYVDLLSNLNLLDKKTLVVLNESNNNVYLSSRNLKQSKVVNSSELSTYNILNASNLVLSVDSLKQIEDILS